MKRLISKKLITFLTMLFFTVVSHSQCDHIIRLTDTYGDGWNGGTVSVQVNGVTVLNNITFNDGYGPVDFVFSANTGQPITVTRTANGSWPSEMRIEVLNPFCTTLYGLVEPVNAGTSFNANCGTGAGEYTTVGNSTVSADGLCVVLTQASNGQKGCSWDANSTLNFASDFSYDLTVNLGSDDGGADGLCFVIQNDPRGICACGGEGGGMGAAGITNSLIVEIDTYLNSEDRDDGLPGVICIEGPDPDHMDIWLNGNVNPNHDGDDCSMHASERIIPTAQPLLTNGGTNYNVENGLNHTLRVSWNAESSTFTAQLKDATPGTHSYATVSHSFNPMTVFGTNTPNFGFTASTGGLNNEHSFCLPPVLLPIELVDFKAECNDDEVIINWSTASELNNYMFTIEKSYDMIDVVKVTQTPGAGNSVALLEYQHVDDRPLTGVMYYRLKQMDYDGTEKTFPWISLSCSSSLETALIYPNPTNSQAFLQLPMSYQDYENEIRIFDLTGKMIELIHVPKNHQEAISLTENKKSVGNYIVTINNLKYTESLPFIIR
jgi:hypothetical protein